MSRGIQEVDVFGAADALLAERLRPTIERVRQKIGRGSPNTVSPILDRWYAGLGDRLVGSNSAPAEDAGHFPADALHAMQLFWEAAGRAAETAALQKTECTRTALQAREDELNQREADLLAREKAFAAAGASLEAALASSQQGRELLERQLHHSEAEVARVRRALETEADRRQHLMAEGLERLDQLRREHAEAIGARDRDLKGAFESHAGNLKRMLAELDQARQRSKSLEAELAKEMERKNKAEAQGKELLAAEQRRLHEARDAAHEMETTLRQSLADRTVELARAQSETKNARDKESIFEQQIREERAGHEATRQLLSCALPARSHDELTVRPKRRTDTSEKAKR